MSRIGLMSFLGCDIPCRFQSSEYFEFQIDQSSWQTLLRPQILPQSMVFRYGNQDSAAEEYGRDGQNEPASESADPSAPDGSSRPL